MLLKDKNAVIFGGGGSLGGAIAKAFAKQGARVFVTGHREDSIKKTADEITAEGGHASYAIVDALDKNAIEECLNKVVETAGSVDITFNGIDTKDVQNIPLVDMTWEDFHQPIHIGMKTAFLTATAAGRVMKKQGRGVILSITATPAVLAYPLVGGFGPACCALEGFMRDLATEIGPFGVRVVNLRSAGSPDTKPFQEALKSDEKGTATFLKALVQDTMLKSLPMKDDIANVAVFAASALADKITGVTLDVTSGTTAGFNAKNIVIPFVS
ncbi:SDR family NAD(P)-dependent oxidoreductase [Pollutibacter soli]|uniref:SDR family NAD(P)-dependent oxidoreductase n=1 Tax=Pollutibacter soli TaxID=3034157 RepID=UPI003013849D